jgi:hypothetical protein
MTALLRIYKKGYKALNGCKYISAYKPMPHNNAGI